MKEGQDTGRVGGVGGPCSPCARGRARERVAWQAGLWEAPAPAAPEVEEEAVLEVWPLHATKHTGKPNIEKRKKEKNRDTQTRKDQWPIGCEI